QQRRCLPLDAADGVELVEIRRQVHQEAVDITRIIVPGRQVQNLTVGGQALDEGPLRLAGQQRYIRGAGGQPAALRRQGADQGADAGVGVLDVVDRVLAVLPHRQVQVEVQGAGSGAGVEVVPGGVHADL